MILALVVVLSIDQMRADYLERFAPYFSERGFKRLMREGAYYPNARLDYANAETAPGHASLATGLLPSEHGVIGNRWFDRNAPFDEAKWRWYFDDVYAYRREGGDYSPLPPERQWWRQGGSPWGAAALPPLSQRADRASGAAALRISVSHKETSAKLMGGDRIYWFDTSTAGFVPSTSFNSTVAGYLPGSRQWKPLAGLSNAVFDPPAAWPLKNTRYGGTFPHPVADARALTYSPFGHELLFDFAYHLVVEQSPEVLLVSVSSTDNLGHYYGPDSLEVADSMLRLDRALGHFLDALERRAGDDLRVVLTSDHGIQPTPEIAKLKNPRADAGRLDLRNPDPNARVVADLPPLRIEIERELARRLGIAFEKRQPLRDALVYFFEGTGLYLNDRRIAELQLDESRVKRELREILRKTRGVANAWTSDDDLPPLMRASFRRDRSGDVLIALKPGWMWHWGSNSTTHGQPVDDDLRVPLILWGKGVTPGVYETPMSPAQVWTAAAKPSL